MILKFSIYQIIGSIAIFNTFLLGIINISRKQGNLKANKILGLILIVFGFLIFNSLMLSYDLSTVFLIKTFLLLSQLSLLIGPLILLYTKIFFDKKWKMKSKWYLHCLPFLIFIIYVLIKVYFYNEFILWRSNIRKIGSLIILFHILIYLILAVREISDHTELKKLFSKNTDYYIKEYYGFFLLGFIIIWIAKINGFLFLDVWNRYGFCPYIYSLYFALVFILINLFLYIKIRNPHYLFRKTAQSSQFFNNKRELFINILNEKVVKDKLYKDPNISIKKISAIAKIPNFELSSFISQEYKMNFREFINKYRIEDAIALIQENKDKQKNFLQIAYEVGFNSKSTFNSAFKKCTGITPSNYLKSI